MSAVAPEAGINSEGSSTPVHHGHPRYQQDEEHDHGTPSRPNPANNDQIPDKLLALADEVIE
jgi:hypothetical protein